MIGNHYVAYFYHNLKSKRRTGHVAQWVRVLAAALAEDLNSVPNTHMTAHNHL